MLMRTFPAQLSFRASLREVCCCSCACGDSAGSSPSARARSSCTCACALLVAAGGPVARTPASLRKGAGSESTRGATRLHRWGTPCSLGRQPRRPLHLNGHLGVAAVATLTGLRWSRYVSGRVRAVRRVPARSGRSPLQPNAPDTRHEGGPPNRPWRLLRAQGQAFGCGCGSGRRGAAARQLGRHKGRKGVLQGIRAQQAQAPPAVVVCHRRCVDTTRRDRRPGAMVLGRERRRHRRPRWHPGRSSPATFARVLSVCVE